MAPATDEVVVVPHDPAWIEGFRAMAARVEAVLGRHALAVEHIGSTAVPGLAAKPTIDLLVGLRSLADADACVPLLVADGWEFPVDLNETIVERRFLKRVEGGARTHHVHLVVHGGEQWVSYLRFRDALRASPALRARYAELKRSLADRYRDQRELYTASKTAFVAEVVGSD